MEKLPIRIIPVFLKYDYGQRHLGHSADYLYSQYVFKDVFREVYPFWLDDYFENKFDLQEKILDFAYKIKPDYIYFNLMRNEFDFKTLDYLKSHYKTINWFGDDQWRFENFSKEYAPHFSYSITTDKYSIGKYRDIGYENILFSQWPSYGHRENLNRGNIEYKYDVSFVGGRSAYREWLVEELRKAGIIVQCFGNKWPNGKVSFPEMEDIFLNSKINLNISNSVCSDIRCITGSLRGIKEFFMSTKRIEQIKARNFEIPCFGGFQMANYVPTLEDYFDIGKDLAVYANIEDLVVKTRYFLNNEEERRVILVNGYKKAIEKYTFKSVLEMIFGRLIADKMR